MQPFANAQWDRSGRLRRQRQIRARHSFLVSSSTLPGGGRKMSDDGSHSCLQKLRIILPHVLLFMTTIVYSLVGAVIFYRIELPYETEHIAKHSKAILDAQTALMEVEFDEHDNRSQEIIDDAIDNLIEVSMKAFEEGIRLSDINGTMPKERWNFHSGLFFAVTVLTSIGYGHLVPISWPGRMFCIAYAFLGIPLTLMTIADISKFFADIIHQCEKRLKRMYRTYVYGSPRVETTAKDDSTSDDVPDPFAESSVAAQLLVICLLFTYMSAMGYLFTLIAGWKFLDSFYFCLMTLVTVGFGDIVPEVAEENTYAGWIAFIFVGLILSTLTVDMVGSNWIDRIHSLSRPKFKLFKHDDKHGNQPFTPSDLILIPYIDELSLQIYRQNNVAGMSLATAFKASAAAPLFSFLAKTRLSYPNHAEA